MRSDEECRHLKTLKLYYGQTLVTGFEQGEIKVPKDCLASKPVSSGVENIFLRNLQISKHLALTIASACLLGNISLKSVMYSHILLLSTLSHL